MRRRAARAGSGPRSRRWCRTPRAPTRSPPGRGCSHRRRRSGATRSRGAWGRRSGLPWGTHPASVTSASRTEARSLDGRGRLRRGRRSAPPRSGRHRRASRAAARSRARRRCARRARSGGARGAGIPRPRDPRPDRPPRAGTPARPTTGNASRMPATFDPVGTDVGGALGGEHARRVGRHRRDDGDAAPAGLAGEHAARVAVAARPERRPADEHVGVGVSSSHPSSVASASDSCSPK